MAPNVRGPEKQKRKRAAATFKQNATTQRKKHNNKLAAAAEGTARLDAFVGTRGTSQGEPKNTVPEAVDDADDAGNKVQARSHRNVSMSTTQAGDGTATRGSQQNTPGAERKVMSAGGEWRRRRRRRWWPRAQRELGSLRDCVSSSPTWCREGRRARKIALKVHGVESLGTGRKVRSAEVGPRGGGCTVGRSE